MESNIKVIRDVLGLDQTLFGRLIGVNQSAVSQYERGVITMAPIVAGMLIEAAKEHGLALTYDDVYGPVAGLWDRLSSGIPLPTLQMADNLAVTG